MKKTSSGRTKLSLFMATALVAGTMIGSGVFLLPASLAAFGGISILGWMFTSLGALLLAFSLSRLSKMVTTAGGPYAFTKEAFGELPGFLVGWGYWLALLAGLAAVAVAAVGYMGVFIPIFSSVPILSALVACLIIWVLVAVNIRGVRQAGSFQVVTTLLKVLPIILVIFLGFYFWNFENFTPFNRSEEGDFSAITATATMTLWAFLGIESATVASENVEDPEKNVPKATILGVLIATVIYILGTMSVMSIVPVQDLQVSTAPFADAAKSIMGSAAEYFVAIGAVISCLGAINGIVMMLGQIPFALSRDLLFHPKFQELSKRGTPTASLILSGILTTVFIALNYARGLVDLFTFIILLSTLSMLLPLAFTTMSELIILLNRREQFTKAHIQRSMILGGLAFTYAIWVISGAGQDIVFYGFILFLIGIPFFVLFKWLNKAESDNISDEG